MPEKRGNDGLTDEERAFSTALARLGKPTAAYREIHPDADARTCQRKGLALAQRLGRTGEEDLDSGEPDQEGLLPLERAFVYAYLVRRRADLAFQDIRPKLDASKCRKFGNAIHRRPHVQDAIKRYQEEQWKRAEMSPEEVVARLSEHGRVDITDYVTWEKDGTQTFTPTNELTPEQRAAIKQFTIKERVMIDREGIEVTERTIDFKLNDPQRAMELVGKKHGLWVDKVEHDYKPPDAARTQLGNFLARLAERAATAVPPEQLALPAPTLNPADEVPAETALVRVDEEPR